MNAVAQTFAIALASVAAAATIGVGLADRTAAPPPPAAGGNRAVVAHGPAQVAVVTRLPRVVIEQRRTTLAQAPSRLASAL